MPFFSLNGEIAFVTGAGSGIGQRIAIGFGRGGRRRRLLRPAGSAGLEATADADRAPGRRAVAFAAR